MYSIWMSYLNSSQGFPVKTHSGLPILATTFFLSANIKAGCYRQLCKGHHFREMEVTELLTAFILSQKHLEIYLAMRKTQPCTVLTAAWRMSGPSWADCSGITGYEEGRKWKEKACFYYWLKISKWEHSVIGVLGGSEGLLLESRRRLWISSTHINDSSTHDPESVRSTWHTSSTCYFHIRDVLITFPNRLKKMPVHLFPHYFFFCSQ